MSKLEVDKIDPQSGTDLELGTSGDTITIPTGVTLDASNATTTLPANVVTTDGTQTLTNKSIAATQLTGTVATSNLGTGTADSTTFLRGDQTYASATPAADSITTSQLAYNPNQFRNIIINGDMSLAQRGTSATGLGNGDNGYHTCDRWNLAEAGSPTFEFTQSQVTDVPTGQGFAKSLKMDCTTADASLASTDYLIIQQKFEGQNLQYLKKGTSNAESLTLSFWIKSNKTGTYILELKDDNDRTINKSYTVSSADTWEKKTITYEGDTTGTIDNDNSAGLELNFWLVAGTNYTSGTLQTSWGSKVNANRAVGQVNLADSTANEWYITGVQLEAGTTASDFEFLPVDVNFDRCLRYYQTLGDGSVTTSRQICNASAFTTSEAYGVINFQKEMRAVPSLSVITGSAYYRFRSAGVNYNSTTDNVILGSQATTRSGRIQINVSGATAGNGGWIAMNNATAFVALESEL